MKILGFETSALSAGSLAIYDQWIKTGIQAKQVQAAAAVTAKRGGQSVQYVDKVLQTAAQRGREMEGGAYEETPGKPWFMSHAGVQDFAIRNGITRLDDEQPQMFFAASLQGRQSRRG